jgi:hypothetical protein
MNLEDFRNQQLVGESGVQTNLFNGQILPFLFHDSSNAAFYMTIDALRRMQQSESIGTNNYCIPGIGLWFMSTESFISTIYKIIQEHQRATSGTVTLTANKVIDKFVGIVSYCSNGAAPMPGLRNQIQEFATFRNTLFHDLTFIRVPANHHTLFASHANKLNEVDLIQAAIIALDTFTYLRHTFDTVDLMPNIWISNQFDKADTLFNEIIATSFTRILACKGLTTSLSLRPSTTMLGHQLTIPMKFVISYAGPSYPTSCPPQSSIVAEEVKKAESKRPMEPGKFGIGNYTRRQSH